MARRTFRLVIVTPELIQQIHPRNLKLIEQFLKEKSARTSAETIKNYRSDANIFFVWNVLHNDNKLFTDIKKLDFSNFFSFTTDEMQWGGARNKRMRSFLSSLSAFIEKFLEDEFPNFRNIILKTIDSFPKELRREKTILSDEQVQEIMKHYLEKDIQLAFWLALAIYSGSRFAELLRFTTDIIDENHMAFGELFLETTKQIKTKGRGKDGKMLHKYILKEPFIPVYKKWLEERKNIMNRNNQEHNFLFIRDDGTPATQGTVRSWIATMEKTFNINLYPHALRHYLCTELSRKNIPQPFIQFLFGWSSAEMVNIYNDLTAKDMKWELDNLR